MYTWIFVVMLSLIVVSCDLFLEDTDVKSQPPIDMGEALGCWSNELIDTNETDDDFAYECYKYCFYENDFLYIKSIQAKDGRWGIDYTLDETYGLLRLDNSYEYGNYKYNIIF